MEQQGDGPKLLPAAGRNGCAVPDGVPLMEFRRLRRLRRLVDEASGLGVSGSDPAKALRRQREVPPHVATLLAGLGTRSRV